MLEVTLLPNRILPSFLVPYQADNVLGYFTPDSVKYGTPDQVSFAASVGEGPRVTMWSGHTGAIILDVFVADPGFRGGVLALHLPDGSYRLVSI